MPERVKATDDLARAIADVPSRTFGQTIGALPDGVTQSSWDTIRDRADRAWVQMADSVDWNRVLIEANNRHTELGHGPTGFLASAGSDNFTSYEAICGSCVREVLLAVDTRPSWTEQPESPRELNPEVLPALVAPADDDAVADPENLPVASAPTEPVATAATAAPAAPGSLGQPALAASTETETAAAQTTVPVDDQSLLASVLPQIAGTERWAVRLPNESLIFISGDRIDPPPTRGAMQFLLDDGKTRTFEPDMWRSAYELPYQPGCYETDYLRHRAYMMHTGLVQPTDFHWAAGLWFSGVTGSWSFDDLREGIPYPDPNFRTRQARDDRVNASSFG